MGKRGPAPTPTAVLEKRGSQRAKSRKGEPTPPAGIPDCPPFLRDLAMEEWERKVDQAQAMGVLSVVDGNALARYCQTWAKWAENEQFLVSNGSTYPLRDDRNNIIGVKPFPQLNYSLKLQAEMLRLEREFGFTPSSRTSLDLLPPAPKNTSRFFTRVS